MKDFRENLKRQRKKKRRVVTLSTTVIAAVCCLVATMRITNFPENLIKSKSRDLAENSNSAIISAISDGSENEVIADAKVAAGTLHFVALKSNGTVWTWGDNSNGKLGTNDTTNRATPVIPIATVTLEDGTTKEEEITDAVDVAASINNTMILRKDGTVWMSGSNNYGQLGQGDTVNSTTFKQVKLDNVNGGYLQNVIAIAAGTNNGYAVTKEGYVYGWGLNNYGQLGINKTDGTTTSYKYATRMKDISEVVQIVAGTNYVVMLKTDGTVWGVGYNGYGQLGTNNTTTKILATQMLDADGNALTNVKEIAAGDSHTIILKEDGIVLGVGYNGYGQLGQGNTTNQSKLVQILDTEGKAVENAKHIYASINSTMISTQEKGMYVSGLNGYGQLFTGNTTSLRYATKVQTNKDILLATVSNGTGIVVDVEGMIYTVGDSRKGELGIGTTTSSLTEKDVTIKQIELERQTIDFDEIGQQKQIKFDVKAEYNLLRDILPTGKTTFKSENEDVATVSNTGLITAKAVGSTNIKLYNETNNLYATIKVNVQKENITTVEPKIVGGQAHFAAIKFDGTLWTWGYNENGELGLGDNSNRNTPEKSSIENIIDIAADYYHTLVLKKDGTVWATGRNEYGELGNGTTVNSNTFNQVKLNDEGEYLENIVAVETGYYSSYALAADGTVWSWGYNKYGQLGQGTTDSNAHPYPVKMKYAKGIISIAAGSNFVTMLDYNGKVWSCGYNSNGQLGIGNTSTMTTPVKMLDERGNQLVGVKQLQAGSSHVVLLKENGTVWGVGYNSNGELGNGTTSNTATITRIKKSDGTYIENASKIYAINHSTYILVNDAKGIYATGNNSDGQLLTGNTTNLSYATKVQEDKEILTIGGVLRWGSTVFADTDGFMYACGFNNYGQLGIGTEVTSTTPKQVSVKEIELEKQTIDFDAIGQQEQINFDVKVKYNLLIDTLPKGITTFKSENEDIATVSNTGLITAKKMGSTNIKLYDETNNLYATIKVNIEKENITTVEPKIVGGAGHYAAIKADGSLWTWGYNSKGELGLGDNSNRSRPVKNSIKNVIDVAAGNYHTLVLKKDGTVWSTGYNNVGQLGDGTTVNSNTFHKVKLNDEGEYLEDIVAIAAEDNSSYAITSKGEVYAWGENNYGTLGQGTTDSNAHPYPVKMKNVKGIISIDAENDYVTMLDYNGRVWGLR